MGAINYGSFCTIFYLDNIIGYVQIRQMHRHVSVGVLFVLNDIILVLLTGMDNML